MIVSPPQYDWLINEDTSNSSNGGNIFEESSDASTSEPIEKPNMSRSLLRRDKSSGPVGISVGPFSINNWFSQGDNRGEYAPLSTEDRSEDRIKEYWSDENKIWFDNQNNIGTASYKVENFLVNITITYWKSSTIPTDRSENYYIKKMKCFYFSSEMSKAMKRELLEVDDKTHLRLVNFYERQLEGVSFPNLIRELFGMEKQYSKATF